MKSTVFDSCKCFLTYTTKLFFLCINVVGMVRIVYNTTLPLCVLYLFSLRIGNVDVQVNYSFSRIFIFVLGQTRRISETTKIPYQTNMVILSVYIRKYPLKHHLYHIINHLLGLGKKSSFFLLSSEREANEYKSTIKVLTKANRFNQYQINKKVLWHISLLAFLFGVCHCHIQCTSLTAYIKCNKSGHLIKNYGPKCFL